MKALVYTDTCKVEVLEQPLPEPQVGEALITIDAVGICGSDMLLAINAKHKHFFVTPEPTVYCEIYAIYMLRIQCLDTVMYMHNVMYFKFYEITIVVTRVKQQHTSEEERKNKRYSR